MRRRCRCPTILGQYGPVRDRPSVRLPRGISTTRRLSLGRQSARRGGLASLAPCTRVHQLRAYCPLSIRSMSARVEISAGLPVTLSPPGGMRRRARPRPTTPEAVPGVGRVDERGPTAGITRPSRGRRAGATFRGVFLIYHPGRDSGRNHSGRRCVAVRRVPGGGRHHRPDTTARCGRRYVRPRHRIGVRLRRLPQSSLHRRRTRALNGFRESPSVVGLRP